MAKITIELLDTIQDAFNQHDVEGILSYFADDCEWLMARGPNAPEGRRCIGKAEIGQVLSDRYKIITDMRWVDMRHWVFGDDKACPLPIAVPDEFFLVCQYDVIIAVSIHIPNGQSIADGNVGVERISLKLRSRDGRRLRLAGSQKKQRAAGD